MYSQVKYACIKQKNGPTYAEFLNQSEVKSKNVSDYLSSVNLLHEGQIQEVLPPQDYFTALNEESAFFDSKERLNSTKELRDINNEELPICFSPDFEEDPTPTVQELIDDLRKVKDKYERQVYLGLAKVSELGGSKKKNFQEFTIDNSFGSQCPIF